MEKERIYAYKVKSLKEYWFYNNHDFNTFDCESLEWNGGKFQSYKKEYIFEFHNENIKSNNDFLPLSEREFSEVITRMEKTDKDFADYLKNCILWNGKDIAEMFKED